MVHSGSNHLPTNGTIAFGEERAPMCYEMANRDGRAMLLVTLHVCILVWLQLVGSQQDNTSTSYHSIPLILTLHLVWVTYWVFDFIGGVDWQRPNCTAINQKGKFR